MQSEQEIMENYKKINSQKDLSLLDKLNQSLNLLSHTINNDLQKFIITHLLIPTLCKLTQQSFVVDNFDSMEKVIKHCENFLKDTVKLWVLICCYLSCTNDLDKTEYFKLIELVIIKLLQKDKPTALRMLNTDLLPLIKKVYLTVDLQLIGLFKKYFPRPPIGFFESNNIPEILVNEDKKIAESIGLVANKMSLDEKTIISVQRKFRGYLRRKEDLSRLTYLYEQERKNLAKFDRSIEYIDSVMPAVIKEKLELELIDANTLYQPKKCSLLLSKRIIDVAKQIKLFDTVRHITGTKCLKSILDDGLRGRKDLLNFYMPFSPAALGQYDISNGDANAICLGPMEIDPSCLKDDAIEIVYDLTKIDGNNPCIFYKQRDFGYENGGSKVRTVEFPFGAQSKLCFRYKSNQDNRTSLGFNDFNSCLMLLNEQNPTEVYAIAKVPIHSLIAYNFKDMQQILILNFFRFIDNLVKVKESLDSAEEDLSTIQEIYAALEKLTDNQLKNVLYNIGLKMIDIAEFNFYGAHILEFSAIHSINVYRKYYGVTSNNYSVQLMFTLGLEDFIEKIKKDDINALQEVLKEIPNLFESYRFVNYLQSQIDDNKCPKIKAKFQKMLQNNMDLVENNPIELCKQQLYRQQCVKLSKII